MNITWNSFEEISRYLGVEDLSGDPPALRSELRKRVAAAHPDSFGGTFKDEQHASEYHRLEAALRFVDSQAETALVPFGKMQLVVANMVKALEQWNAAKEQEFKKAIKASAIEFSRRKVLFPRISSATLLTICSVLLAFPGQFIEHPFAQRLFSSYKSEFSAQRYRDKADLRKQYRDALNPSSIYSVTPASTPSATVLGVDATPSATQGPAPTSSKLPISEQSPFLYDNDIENRTLLEAARDFRLGSAPKDFDALEVILNEQRNRYLKDKVVDVCLSLFLLCAVALLWTWLREHKIRSGVEHLTSEDALHVVFEELVGAHEISRTFGFRDLLSRVRRGIAGAPPLPAPLAEQIATGLIERLLKRNAIKRTTAKSLEECFVLTAGASNGNGPAA
jgi:hypothetical protein